MHRYQATDSPARPGRTAKVCAVLFAVACGLFAGSFGSWIGWHTIRPLSHGEAADVIAELLPGRGLTVAPQDPAAPFLFYDEPLTWDAVGPLLLGDGGEYSRGTVGATVDGPAEHPEADFAMLTSRLRRGGWEFRDLPVDGTQPAPGRHDLAAGRGDQVLDISIYPDGAGTYIALGLTRTAPPLAVAGGVVGSLAGAAGGFLLFGRASRRGGGSGAKVLFGCGLFLWCAPTAVMLPQVAAHHLNEWHYSRHPMWEWLGQPTLSLPFVIGTALLLTALAVTTRRPRRTPVPDPVAA